MNGNTPSPVEIAKRHLPDCFIPKCAACKSKQSALSEEIQTAVETEREACAALVESVHEILSDPKAAEQAKRIGAALAQAIRARNP